MAGSMSDKFLASVQAFENKIISSFISLRYFLLEPIILRVARLKFNYKYQKIKKLPLISVCIPTFNRGQILIERAIKSALAQTYANFEIIVVGDHCTDNTEELLKGLKDSRIKFYNLPFRKRKYPKTIENHWFVGGAIPANKAMEIAKGDWIARLDDDDIWTPEHLEKLLQFAQSNNYEFVSGQYIEERFGVRKIIDGVRARDAYFTQKPNRPNDQSPKIGGVNSWLYRSYLRFMPYNTNCWRKKWNRVWDVDLAMRIYSAGARIGFMNEVVAYVLPRPGESSVGLDAYKIAEKEKMEKYKF